MEQKNVKELKLLAKERGIPRYYWLRRAQLIEALDNVLTQKVNKDKIIEDITQLKNNKYKCIHGKIKYCCKLCSGSQICIHGKIKYRCKECGGSQICEHGKQKQQCKECGGSQICEHGKQKASCKECRIKKKINYDLKI